MKGNRSIIIILRILSAVMIGGSLYYGITSGEASMLWFFGLGVVIVTVSLIIE